MSISIKYDDISSDISSEISKDICIIEEENFMEKKSKWSGKGYKSIPKKPYIFSADNGENIRIPYYTAVKYGFCQKEYDTYPKMNPSLKISENFKFKKLEFEAEDKIEIEDQEEYIKDSINYLDEYGTTTIGTRTGSGKSKMAIYISFTKQLITLILLHRDPIKQGWKKEIDEMIPGAIIWDTNLKMPEQTPDFIVTLPMGIDKIPEDLKIKIGMFILDEVRELCTVNNAEKFLQLQPRYIIVESATIEKPNGLHQICYAMAGTHGIFSNPKIPYKFYKLQTNVKVEEEKGKNGLIIAKAWISQSQSEERIDVLIKIILNNLSHKFIVMCRVCENIDLMVEIFRNLGITADSFYGNKKTYNDSQVLFGIYQKMGIGFDEAKFCKDFTPETPKSNILIIYHSIKEPAMYKQAIGRVMRALKFSVILLCDKNKFSNDHLRAIKPTITETKGQIVEVTNVDNFFLPVREL